MKLLDTLLNKYIEDRENALTVLEDEYAIPFRTIDKEVDSMCNLSKGIYDKGITEGENLLAKLIEKLLSVGRNDDILKVSTDPDYRRQLYAEFGLV